MIEQRKSAEALQFCNIVADSLKNLLPGDRSCCCGKRKEGADAVLRLAVLPD